MGIGGHGQAWPSHPSCHGASAAQDPSIASTCAVPYARTAHRQRRNQPASICAALKITRLDTLPFGLPPSLPPTATMASPHYLLQQLASDRGGHLGY